MKEETDERAVSRNPWRYVVNIEIASPGKNGARPWMLTLECGHVVFRSRGDTKSEVRAVVWFHRKPKLAPHRIRCMHCGIAERKGRS